LKAFPAPAKVRVCKELQRRGYFAINGDSELAYQGDPETGKPALRISAGLVPFMLLISAVG
jgi:hypothetical protein